MCECCVQDSLESFLATVEGVTSPVHAGGHATATAAAAARARSKAKPRFCGGAAAQTLQAESTSSSL